MINTAIRFDDLIKNHISLFLKTHGFKKKNLNYLDFGNEVSFIINFQKSHGCSWEENMFYIHYGFFIPELRKNNEQLKTIWECDNSYSILPNAEFQDTYRGFFSIKDNTDIGKLSDFIIKEIQLTIFPYFERNKSLDDAISFILEMGTRNEQVLFEYLLRNKKILELSRYLNRVLQARAKKTDEGSISANLRYMTYLDNIFRPYNITLQDITGLQVNT